MCKMLRGSIAESPCVALLILSLFILAEGFASHDYKDEEDEEMKKRDLMDDYTDDEDKSANRRETDMVKRSANDAIEYSLTLYHKNATRFQTNKLFVSVGLATTIFHRVSYNSFGVDNRAFRNLAESLSPAIVRVGGSNSGFMIFQSDDIKVPVSNANFAKFKEMMHVEDFYADTVAGEYQHFNVTDKEWEVIHQFFKDIGWKMNFNLNSFLWNYRYQADFKNIQYLLNFCNKTQLPFYGFQFFNEPNSYSVKFDGFIRTPEELTSDWARLKEIQELPENAYFKDTLRIGPGVTSISRHPSSYRFLEEFFEAGGYENQDVLGLHHYYFSGPLATVDDFMNPDYYDTLGEAVRLGRGLCDKYKPEMPVHLSEVSDGFGGGSNPLSHTFVSTFLFMDMLGQAALYGAEVVNKYTYFSGDYGMVGPYANPRPNYWIALLHKRLIDGPVLVANITETNDRYFRTYAHCVQEGYRYGSTTGSLTKSGGFVITYINLHNRPINLNIPYKRDVHMFKFTGQPDVDDETMLSSEDIYLNGEKLEMVGECVPTLKGEAYQKPEYVEIPKHSVGFIMYPFAYATDCLNNRNPVEEY